MRDQERDLLRKTILQFIQMKGTVRYTALEKHVVATCMPFATSHTVRRQFYEYLLAEGFVERINRGRFRLTERGTHQLVAYLTKSQK